MTMPDIAVETAVVGGQWSAVGIAPLAREHRARVREILVSTAVFRDEEVAVALELFDEAFPRSDKRTPIADSRQPTADYTFIGAFAQAELTGFACYGPTPDTDRTFDLYWLAVDPGAQGAGTGSRLLRAVEDTLRGGRGRMVVAETSSRSDYQATRAFYERRGFREAARVSGFYAPGDDRIIYTKRIELVPPRAGREQCADE